MTRVRGEALAAELLAAADGFEWICTLAALFDVGLMEALDRERPVSADGLASRLGLVPALTVAALDQLEAREVIVRAGDGVVLTERGAALATSDLAHALAVLVPRAYGAIYLSAGDLIAGRTRVGDGVERDPLARARGRSRFQRAAGQNRRVIAALEERGARGVVDLGCGTGALLLDHAASGPGRGGVGIDRCAAAVAEASAAVARGADVRFVAGDPLDADVVAGLAGGVDAFTLLGASHECERLDDDALVRFFTGLCRAAPGRWIFLGDKITVSPADRWRQALSAQGRQRLEADWRALLARTPVTIERCDPPPPGAPPFSLWSLRT